MKKIFCYILVLLMILCFIGCGEKENVKTEEELKAEIRAEMEAEEAATKPEEEKIKEDDEIVTTYVLSNLEGIDVSELKEVIIDAEDITKESEPTSDMVEYKIAFFGESKNVKINYSSYAYESEGKEIASYDSLKDTLLIIKSHKLEHYQAFIAMLEDGRGMGSSITVGDSMVASGDKVELKSGFATQEKMPSPYAAYDMSDIVNSIGMTTDEFENSDMMLYAEKEMMDGMDDMFYNYSVNNLIKGVKIEFTASETEKIIKTCYLRTDKEIYKNLLKEEKYSFLGMDFDMSVVRATYNRDKSDTLPEIDAYGAETDSIIDTIVLSM